MKVGVNNWKNVVCCVLDHLYIYHFYVYSFFRVGGGGQLGFNFISIDRIPNWIIIFLQVFLGRLCLMDFDNVLISQALIKFNPTK